MFCLAARLPRSADHQVRGVCTGKFSICGVVSIARTDCRGRDAATCELIHPVPVLERLLFAFDVASLIEIDELLDKHVSAVTLHLITSTYHCTTSCLTM